MHIHHSKFDLRYASYFTDWLNKNYNLDYQAFENNVQDSPIDAYAESSSGLPKLNFQMRLAEGGVLKVAHENTKRFKRGKDMRTADVNFDRWITTAITSKENKYDSETKKNLILIVQGYIPAPELEEVRKFYRKHENSDFKAIYYVSMPTESYPPQKLNGYVEPIKDLFNDLNLSK